MSQEGIHACNFFKRGDDGVIRCLECKAPWATVHVVDREQVLADELRKLAIDKRIESLETRVRTLETIAARSQ